MCATFALNEHDVIRSTFSGERTQCDARHVLAVSAQCDAQHGLQ